MRVGCKGRAHPAAGPVRAWLGALRTNRPATRAALALVWAAGLLLQPAPGTAGSPSAPAAESATPSPDVPLAQRIAAARPGDTLVVRGGVHRGPLVIDRPLRLVGEGAVIDGGGQGTVVHIAAPGVELEGFAIRGSGRSLDREDAGVLISAPGARVAGNRLEGVLFGIVAKNAPGARIEGNRLVGLGAGHPAAASAPSASGASPAASHDEAHGSLALSLAGDGIRLWYSDGARVAGNHVTGFRQVLVEFSRQVAVVGNRIEGCIVGLHLMRAGDVTVEDNEVEGNHVGIYAMYTGPLTVRRNRVRLSQGPSGYGMALKEGESQVVEANWIEGNRVGLYLDQTPIRPDRPNRVAGNALVGNGTGIWLTPAATGNRFQDNDLVGNTEQVGVTGGRPSGQNEWAWEGRGNYWSDYAGYDRDGDGLGELPYVSQRWFEALSDRHPALQWFRDSPVAGILDFLARAFPALAPEEKARDPHPRLRPARLAPAPPGPGPARWPLGVAGAALLALGLGLAASGLAAARPPAPSVASASPRPRGEAAP